MMTMMMMMTTMTRMERQRPKRPRILLPRSVTGLVSRGAPGEPQAAAGEEEEARRSGTQQQQQRRRLACQCSTETHYDAAVAFRGERNMRVTLCRACIRRRFNHGSTEFASIRPSALRPFLHLAEARIAAAVGQRGAERVSAYAVVLDLQRLLVDGRGRDGGARHPSSAATAAAALARWRALGHLSAERMLSAHLAVTAYLASTGTGVVGDDADRRAYRHAQVAHAVRRAASVMSLKRGPRGPALRLIGEWIEDACGALSAIAVPAMLSAALLSA
jgi:hypothetical protein